jgi:integrase-like protein
MGTRAPRTIPAESAFAKKVRFFASMLPASRSGTTRICGAKRRARAATAKTFRDAAAAFIRDNKSKWKNPKHVAQYYMTLLGETEDGEKTENNYCTPIHDIAIGEIDTALVLSVLRPIWHKKPETASRLRGRIEKVIGYAMINGLCDEGLNPARWKGHLENARPAKGEVREVKHHAAPPYSWMRAPWNEEGTAATFS